MAQPVAISSVPNELWANVFSSTDIPTLAKVALVCKEWNGVIEQLNWKEIHLLTFSISFDWIGPVPPSWKQYCLKVYKFFESFGKNDTCDCVYYENLGKRLYKKKFINEALAIFQEKSIVDSVGRCCYLARIFLGLRRYQDCHRVLSESCLQQNEDILRIKGDVFLEQKEFEKAKIAYEQSLQLEDSLQAQLGLLTLLRDEERTALQLQIETSVFQSTNLMRASYFYNVFRDRCYEMAKKAYELEPQKDIAAYLMAQCSKDEEAKNWYELSIQHNPFNLKVILDYISFIENQIYNSVYKEINTPSRVQNLRQLRGIYLERARELNPNDPHTMFLTGVHAYELGHGKEAVGAFQKAIDLGFTPLRQSRGRLILALLLDKQFEKAETYCREELKENRCEITGLLLCKSLIEQRPFTPIKKLEICAWTQQYPEKRDSLLLQAQVAELEENYQEAEEKYRLVLEKKHWMFEHDFLHFEHQDLETVHSGIVNCLYHQGKVTESQKYALEVAEKL